VPRVQVSTCIIIKNMFSPAEETEPNWDQDIKEDVSIEAGKHGRLKHVFVDKNSAVRCLDYLRNLLLRWFLCLAAYLQFYCCFHRRVMCICATRTPTRRRWPLQP